MNSVSPYDSAGSAMPSACPPVGRRSAVFVLDFRLTLYASRFTIHGKKGEGG